MIRLSFRITWPLALLIGVAVVVWLWRHSQARPATQPLERVIYPAADGQPTSASESTFDRIEREAAEAGRRAYADSPDPTGAADRLRSKRYARQR